MPDARVEAVYQELILEHYRRPRNRRVIPGADRTASLRNPLCGDEITVYLSLDGEVVREAAFTGQGCSITKAAASMLTEAVRGLSRAEGRALLARYEAMLAADAGADAPAELGELRALAGVTRVPARIPCARMPERALAAALADDGG